MASRLPDPWEHRSGYYLNADGKAIKYEHAETGAEIIVEAALNEDDGEMEYLVFLFDGGGDSMAHPANRNTKDGAWATAETWAEKHA